MQVEPLVVTTRGIASPATSSAGPAFVPDGAVENVHHGSVAVVSVDGGLVHWAGDPHYLTFTRSTLKPLQAFPFVREGGPARFGWGSREIAMMCASHSGEDMHVRQVASMLQTSGCDASQLQCGCHVPGWYAALDRKPPDDLRFGPIEHNCSGKHAGFLAACRLHGERVEDYLDPDAPLQRRIASAVGEIAAVAPHELVAGTDGCSAPNYAIPLSRLALAYARLAQGRMAPFEGETFGALFDAMTRHPELVSGTARSDLALMSYAPGDWVAKIGADGAQAVGIRSAGIGIAVKVADGNREALYVAVIDTLRQLGLFGEVGPTGAPDALARWGGHLLRNAKGLVVGKSTARFKLRAA